MPERIIIMKKISKAYTLNTERCDITRIGELRADKADGMTYFEAWGKYPEMRNMVDRIYGRD